MPVHSRELFCPARVGTFFFAGGGGWERGLRGCNKCKSKLRAVSRSTSLHFAPSAEGSPHSRAFWQNSPPQHYLAAALTVDSGGPTPLTSFTFPGSGIYSTKLRDSGLSQVGL